MAKLFKAELGQLAPVLAGASKAGMTDLEFKKLGEHHEVWSRMLEVMREHPKMRLIHGLFHQLDDKLEMAREYPGVKGKQIDSALKEARGRIARFEAEGPGNSLLDIIVSVYLDSVSDNLAYARDRMSEAHGDEFRQWDYFYSLGFIKDNVRLLQDEGGNTIVPVHTNCIRIEVIDLSANFNPEDGMVPEETRGANSAGVSLIYAAAEDPVWVRHMDGENVPYALAGGIELNVPGGGPWAELPGVWRHERESRMDPYSHGRRYHLCSLPVVWE